MFRITKETDYGIVLLSLFGAEGTAVQTARGLAEAARLPLPMVGKILKSLARAGLLTSTRGAHGGYRLAKRPESVSVAEVIGAIDGPIALTQCLGHSLGDGHDAGACALEPSCPTRPHWSRINRAVLDALERLPLSELVAPARPSRRARIVPLEPLQRESLQPESLQRESLQRESLQRVDADRAPGDDR